MALLTEYVGKNNATIQQVGANHVVLKAVLLNSADKIKGELPGPNGEQRMARTVLDTKGDDWILSNFTAVHDAYPAAPNAALVAARQSNPLNFEFGAGALNVGRAIVQLNGGQLGRPANQPNAPVGAIGWDGSAMDKNFAEVQQINDPSGNPILRRKYELPTLQAGQYLSATLNFERPVTMTDAAGAAKTDYQPGYKFDAGAFNNKPPDLNLYLMPKDATSLDQAVWASNSDKSSVEHFFFQMPNPGAKYGTKELYSKNGYELWVTSREINTPINYGLAWWGVGVPAAPPPRLIKGVAWDDANGDGLRGPSEPGRSGVLVSLLDGNDNLINSVRTDFQGRYSFGVSDGMYRVEFGRPATAAFTTANVGSDDTIDSDANTSTGRTGVITVSGADVDSVDAGFVGIPLGTVSGRAWDDTDGDGLQGTGEGGYAGVRVDLVGTDGGLAGSTVTDSGGNYQFTGVAPGEYVVAFEPLVNAVFSPQDAGSDAIDSDPNATTGLTPAFTLASGGAAVRDAGLRTVFGSVAGTVYFDEDEDGTQDTGEEGVASQGVSLFDYAGEFVASTSTDADGNYRFDDLAPGSYTVEFTPDVFWEFTAGGPTQGVSVSAGTTADADAGLTFTTSTALIAGRVWDDADENGLQDTGEAGRENVTVELVDSTTQTVVGATTTDSNGDYAFVWVAPGAYDIRVVSTDAGTLMNQGTDDEIDSDFDPSTLTVYGLEVDEWEFVEHLDAGLIAVSPPPPPPPTGGTITGRIWHDVDADGIQDEGEVGYTGVVIRLLDLDGNVIAETTPFSQNGDYRFMDVAPGQYRIWIDPVAWLISPQDQGTDDGIDSDLSSLGYSAILTVTAGSLFDIDAGVNPASP